MMLLWDELSAAYLPRPRGVSSSSRRSSRRLKMAPVEQRALEDCMCWVKWAAIAQRVRSLCLCVKVRRRRVRKLRTRTKTANKLKERAGKQERRLANSSGERLRSQPIWCPLGQDHHISRSRAASRRHQHPSWRV